MRRLSQQKKLLEQLKKSGVIIDSADAVWTEGKIKIKQGTRIKPDVYLTNIEIGQNCLIGPNAEITDSIIGHGAKILFGAQVKRSTIGDDFRMCHFGYLGDAKAGHRVNFSAGAITGNFDGKNKHKTTIGDDVMVGIGVKLVAPITIASGCFAAGGSTIPAGEYKEKNKLIICRTKDVVIKPRKK